MLRRQISVRYTPADRAWLNRLISARAASPLGSNLPRHFRHDPGLPSTPAVIAITRASRPDSAADGDYAVNIIC